MSCQPAQTDRPWSVRALYRLCREDCPELPDTELQARAQALARFHQADIRRRRRSAAKFKHYNRLIGGELYTDTDDLWRPQ